MIKFEGKEYHSQEATEEAAKEFQEAWKTASEKGLKVKRGVRKRKAHITWWNEDLERAKRKTRDARKA